MYTNLISKLETEMETQRLMLETLRTMPELEGINRMQPAYRAGMIILLMPYDLPMFHRNREKLEALGFAWDGNQSVSPHCGDIITYFTKGNLEISIHINPDLAGSTCKKNLIGYEQKPIYEVTCMDAEPLVA